MVKIAYDLLLVALVAAAVFIAVYCNVSRIQLKNK